MDYPGVLGTHLKSEFLIDLFETYDVDVIYSYDRTYENIEDGYYASIPAMGLQFMFDSSQRVRTLFMTRVEHTGFNPFQGDDPRDVDFRNGTEGVKYAERQEIDFKYREARTDSFFGELPEFILFKFEAHSVHYEFEDEDIKLVTLQSKNA